MILPDANVLVYAARDDSPDAARYRAWLECALLGPEPVALTAPVVAGFLRIVTNPRIHLQPSSLDDALGFVQVLLGAPATTVPALPGRLVETLADVCRRSGAKAEHVPDAHLAAIAMDLDAELVTADRGFARYPGLRWRHPLDA